MTAHVCITNLVRELRPCTVRDEHLPHCDAHQHVWNAELAREVILDTPCGGCLPREAEYGYLCAFHVVKLGAALKAVGGLVFRMIDDPSNGARDTNEGGGHVAPSPSWPLLESRNQAAWIVAAMRNTVHVLDGDDWDLTYYDYPALPSRANARQAARMASGLSSYLARFGPALGGTKRSAEAVVRFVDFVQRANATFPTTERARAIAGIRCPECSMAKLSWIPPLSRRDDVAIRCSGCGETQSQDWIEQYEAILQFRSA